MWRTVRKLLSLWWQPLRAALGDVIFETQPIEGQTHLSTLQWRIKQDLETGGLYVSLKVVPDYYAGSDGRTQNYIDFTLDQALEVQKTLALCIAKFETGTGN